MKTKLFHLNDTYHEYIKSDRYNDESKVGEWNEKHIIFWRFWCG